jgi:hypothetical protein
MHLASASSKVDFDVGSIPLVLNSETADVLRKKLWPRSAIRKISSGPNLEFGPFPVALGRGAPATARGWAGRSGYTIWLSGDAEIARTLRAARVFGLPVVTTTSDGIAQLDLQVAGSWVAWSSAGPVVFPQPEVTGTAKLHNVHADLRGVDSPVEVSSADVLLLPDEVRVAKLNANAAHAIWKGSLNWPRGCGAAGACLVHFNLSTSEARLTPISQWVSPGQKKRLWYQVLTSAPKSGPPFLASLRAYGRVSAGRLLIRDFSATHVSANVNLEGGKMRVSNLRGDFLGAKHRGEWQMDFSVKPPAYTGSGTFTGISLARLAEAMNDDWIMGTADGSYQVKASGLSSAEFWQSAQGTLQFVMRDGMLPHISLLDDGGPLRVGRFEGRARLHDGTLEMDENRLNCADGAFEVSGTASLTRELDLKLAHAHELRSARATTRGYAITGTIADPRVELVAPAETQAALKQ